MIEFSIPDLWNNFGINLILIDMMYEEPNKFYDDISITSCYGSFPCIWNGGRLVQGMFPNAKVIEGTLLEFNDRGIKIRYTFTNRCLEDTSIYDTVGNAILKISNNYNCDINVFDPRLESYIRTNYPKFDIVYSTTLNLNTIEKLNEASAHNLVIPDYTVNNNFEILSKLTHPENIEMLVAEFCVDNCPCRVEHWKQCSCELMLIPYTGPFISCPFKSESDVFETIKARKHFITNESIRAQYADLGISKFKIGGRRDGVYAIIDRYIYYLVKPEFENEIRNKLLVKYDIVRRNSI